MEDIQDGKSVQCMTGQYWGTGLCYRFGSRCLPRGSCERVERHCIYCTFCTKSYLDYPSNSKLRQ